MKCGGFRSAWGGIASLELVLPVMATLYDSPVDLARWMAEAPASLAGLERKGRIAPGYDADLVLFDPEARWTVGPESLDKRHKDTAELGRRLRGRVRCTLLHGEKHHDGGA